MTDRTHSARRYGTPARPSILERLRMAFDLQRERQDLARLDPHLRRDVGLTEDDVRRETKRSVWDAPRHWHQ
jgi:uncharacterized protein YjiS (DUF1127 family)